MLLGAWPPLANSVAWLMRAFQNLGYLPAGITVAGSTVAGYVSSSPSEAGRILAEVSTRGALADKLVPDTETGNICNNGGIMVIDPTDRCTGEDEIIDFKGEDAEKMILEVLASLDQD